MNKITIQFTLASLLYASISYTPLAHSSWNQAPTSSYTPSARSVFYIPPAHSSAPWIHTPTPFRTTSESAWWTSMYPELQAHGFTPENLAPFAMLATRAQKFLTQNEFRQLTELIAENITIRNLLTEKNEQIKVTYGTLAVANKIIEDLYQQIEQLCQQSETAQRELTTIQEQPTDLVLSIAAHAHQFAIKERELAAFKRHTKNEQIAAQKREKTTAHTLSTKRDELAHTQQQLTAKEDELATFIENMQRSAQTATREQLAAREREQALVEELATVKTMLAGTQHELEGIKKHPQILLPVYHFSEEL